MKNELKNSDFRPPSSRSIFYFERNVNTILNPSPTTKRLMRLYKENKLIPQSILDFGCGNGRNSVFLAQEFGSEVTLVDKKPEFIEAAESNLLKSGYSVKKKIIEEIENLNRNELESYDVVLCNYVLQNIHPNHYPHVLSLLHSVTNQFLIFEIYQNVIHYEIGKFTFRGSTGWYGFTKNEIISLINSGFNIIWKTGSLAWKRGSNTISYILSPKSKFSDLSLGIFKKNIPVSILSKPSLKPTEKHDKKNKHRFYNIYPPCENCNERECDEYSCITLKLWIDSLPTRSEEKGLNIKQLKKDNPVCKLCDLKACQGLKCSKLSFWTKNISPKNIKSPDNKINDENIVKLLKEADIIAQNLCEKDPSLKKLTQPALLYLASRIEGIPITLEDFRLIFSTDKSKLFKTISRLQKTNKYSFKPIDYLKYIYRYSSTLLLLDEEKKFLENVIQYLKSHTITEKKMKRSSPIVLAAALLNYSVQQSTQRIIIDTISEKCNVSKASIKKVTNQLKTIY